jgi:hypothetical protein
MKRETFIRRWLGAKDKPYTEQFRDEMRDDLDKVIEYAQQQVKNLNIPAVINNEAMKCSCGKPCRIPLCFDCFKKGLEPESEVAACQGCGRKLDQMDYAVGLCYECGLII